MSRTTAGHTQPSSPPSRIVVIMGPSRKSGSLRQFQSSQMLGDCQNKRQTSEKTLFSHQNLGANRIDPEFLELLKSFKLPLFSTVWRCSSVRGKVAEAPDVCNQSFDLTSTACWSSEHDVGDASSVVAIFHTVPSEM